MAKTRGYKQRNILMMAMLAPYLFLLIVFGILPLIMAVLEVPGISIANPDGGWDAFRIVLQDFRFPTAFKNVLGFMAYFVPMMIIVVIGMALMLDVKTNKWSKYLRLAYIVPASISGAVAVLVWWAIFEPTISPIKSILNFFGVDSARQIWQTENLIYLIAIMTFFSMAGNWILIQYGSLQSISTEIIEAARVDGCSAFQLAFRIKLPLIRKYVIYMAVLDVPFRRFLLFSTLVTMLIPITAMAMPLYVLIDRIHLNNTLLGLILASSYFPFGAFLSYLYYSSVLPQELVGMGRIDGLTDFGIYRHLGIPLSKSLISIVTFFSFVGLWNSYQLPRVLLIDPSRSVMSIGIEVFYGQGTTLIGIMMLIPSVLLYLASQKTIARGIFSGAMKG